MLITTTEEYKRAIERQGDFGRLFLEYIGCPRGAVGRMGSSGGECPSDCQRLTKEVLLQPVIKDVDGGRWIPVNEDALKELVEKYAATCDLLEHRVPTEEGNKPLTVEELREMDGEPVWVVCEPDADGERLGLYALVEVDADGGEVYLTNNLGRRTEFSHPEDFAGVSIYRCKPEKGE